MRREGERRQAGGQPGHQGAGRELRPEDQVDEIVDHYPDRRVVGAVASSPPKSGSRGGRFGRHQVAELPPISVIVTEHRTHQLRCPGCRSRTSARLPNGIGAGRVRAEVAGGDRDVDRPTSDLAPRDRQSSRATCSASRSRPARPTRSASAPPTRSPARTCTCRTGCWISARCMSMRPAGGPAARAARCGPRPPRMRRSSRSPSTATASSSTRSSAPRYPGIVDL